MTKAPSPDRKTWMATLAKAPPERLAALMPDLPPHEVLRAPEIGAVMVQGRTGATGAPFNLGEMTVTRASVRLGCGTVGHAWVQGRDKAHARCAALADALLQTDALPATLAGIIEPLQAEAASEKAARAAKAAGTKVDFFTMVRGDNT